MLARLLVVGALAGFVVSCGEDDPTSLGSDQRAHPDTLQVAELVAVLEDSVFHLPNSLGASRIGQIGMQQLYTAHALFDFRVPTMVLDDGDTLRMDAARLEIGFADAAAQPYKGTMRLRLHEVAPAGRTWAPDSILTRVPELQPGPPAAQDTVPIFSFGDPEFDIDLEFDPTALAGFDSVAAGDDSLDVNIACLFDTFTVDGPGFIEFPYEASNGSVSNVRFVGNYSNNTNTGIERSFRPRARLVVVEFDPAYSPGTHWVASDGYRLHTFARFDNVGSVLPAGAVVFGADLILTQADRGDSLFGTGPNIGVIVPSDTLNIYSEAENERALGFQSSIVAVPESDVVVNVTAYLFDQQEGTVENRGMLLRLSNEGTKARHFEFFGSADANAARRPRIRILYALPAHFGGGAP